MPAFAAVPSEATVLSIGEAMDESALLSDVADVVQPDGLAALDRTLVALCRGRGPLRAVLARIAARLVALRAWERLGDPRLSDYAVERLGLSARWVRGLALVGEAFRTYPRLEEALASGALGWTKVRLLASLPRGEDESRWIARAGRLTAEQLSKRVRAVDRGSIEAGGLDDEAVSRLFEVRCSPEVRWKWHAAKSAASRVAGRMVPLAEAAELIAAEVLSALPADEAWEQETCDEAGASWTWACEAADDAAAPEAEEPAEPVSGLADRPAGPPWQGYGALEALLVGLEEADAFELDDRLRRVVSMERETDGAAMSRAAHPCRTCTAITSSSARGRLGRSLQPRLALRIPPPAGRARRADPVLRYRARRAHLAVGYPAREGASRHLRLGRARSEFLLGVEPSA